MIKKLLNNFNKLINTIRYKLLIGNSSGAATAEYAIVIMAAVGFAGLLVVILQSEEVKQILVDLVKKALSV